MEKGTIAIFSALGVLYFLFRPRRVGYMPPVVGEDAVMSYHGWIWTKGTYHGVEPALIASVMFQESRGNPSARGAAGEVGLMQIKPSTALLRGGVFDAEMLPDPGVNIGAGTQYLAYLLDRYNGNIAASVAAYNAGPGRVSVDPNNRRISAPDSAKRYALEVMGRVPRFRDRFKAIPAYAISYGLIFRASAWFMNFESFEGLYSLGYASDFGHYRRF